MAGMGGIGLDLRAEPAHVDIDEPPVAEVAVAPDPLEEVFPAEDLARGRGQLAEEPELGLGEVDLLTALAHQALLGEHLEVAEADVGALDLGGADPAQQRPDAGRQLLGGEGLGEVVVGARLEAGDHVVGVVASGHHDDGHVAGAADRAAELEAVHARQHDVDQYHVGRVRLEEGDGVLAGRGLVDRPALVLERETHGGADSLVVLDRQDPRSHAP